MVNLSSFIRFHALRTPDKAAIVYRGKPISYAEFLTRIYAGANWLSKQGIVPGDVVAVLMKNSAAFLDLAFAVSHVGAVFLPINFRLSADEVSYIVENSGAKLLVVDDELKPNASKTVPVTSLDTIAQNDLKALVGNGTPCPATPRQPDDLFRLMYTSGTTDRPKGVMHTYDNFYWKCADHTVVLDLTSATRLLAVGPLYHVGAFDLPGIAVLHQGGTMILHRDFDPISALESIATEKTDGAWFAPVMTSAILSHPERNRYDVSSLRWAIGGGERTPEARIRAFSQFFINARYVDAYGLTESCSGDTFMEAGREIEKIGSTGRATPHVEVDIRDDQGRTVAARKEGEVCLRGPKVTRGYWKDPAKTKASFFDDWFRTGDVGYLDEDGFLFLTDRKKDMIISGGENIASSEVERVVFDHPAIQDVAVIGIPDERWGEKPAAVVVLRQGMTLDLAGLDEHCRGKLAGFKIPKVLIVRDTLPRNPSGKILKRVLRDELSSH